MCASVIYQEDEEEEGGNGEGNSSTQRLRPNTKFLARFVGGIERVNKRLIAESSSNSSSSGTGSGTGSAGGWGAGGDKDAALAALLPPMPANPQDFEGVHNIIDEMHTLSMSLLYVIFVLFI